MMTIPQYSDTMESDIQEAIDTYNRTLRLIYITDKSSLLDSLTCDVMYSRLQSAGYLGSIESNDTWARLCDMFMLSPVFASIRAMILAGVE